MNYSILWGFVAFAFVFQVCYFVFVDKDTFLAAALESLTLLALPAAALVVFSNIESIMTFINFIGEL